MPKKDLEELLSHPAITGTSVNIEVYDDTINPFTEALSHPAIAGTFVNTCGMSL